MNSRTLSRNCAWGVGTAGCLAMVTLAACQVQQTNIVRTTRLPDGTEYSYANNSSGYGYNPNYTSDQNINVNAPNAAAIVGVNAGGGSGGSWGFGSIGGYSGWSPAYGYGNGYGWGYGNGFGCNSFAPWVQQGIASGSVSGGCTGVSQATIR
ncbi:MAG: hypothetical protein EXS17_08780 [Phycisphaerales bacterium]|nr:hypothetical protein [Phycisphaerales bacterium]